MTQKICYLTFSIILLAGALASCASRGSPIPSGSGDNTDSTLPSISDTTHGMETTNTQTENHNLEPPVFAIWDERWYPGPSHVGMPTIELVFVLWSDGLCVRGTDTGTTPYKLSTNTVDASAVSRIKELLREEHLVPSSGNNARLTGMGGDERCYRVWGEKGTTQTWVAELPGARNRAFYDYDQNFLPRKLVDIAKQVSVLELLKAGTVRHNASSDLSALKDRGIASDGINDSPLLRRTDHGYER